MRIMNRTAILLFASLFALAQPRLSTAALFSSNDVVVVSIGDSTPGDPGSQTVPVVLQGFHPDAFQATPATSLAMPTTASGSNHILTLQNNRAGGGLNLTADGRYLVMGGTDIAPRITPTGTATRTVGRIDALGNIDTSTTFSDGYVGATRIGIRSVASADGSSYYLAGNGDGSNEVRYIAQGGNSSTALADTASRHVAIYGGSLFLAKDASMNQVGSGLPTSGSPAVVALPGVGAPPAGGNWNSPVMFDLNPAVAGLDTLYLGVQRSNSVELPAVVKYTFDGSNWTQATTFDLGVNTGMLFLTGRLEAGNVVLYGSTDNAGAPTFGNSLVKMTDLGAGSTFTTLATADATHGFRGVAFTPVPEPATFVLAIAAAAALALPGRHRFHL